jgi:hypothetical protein
MIQMLELINKDFKTHITKMLQKQEGGGIPRWQLEGGGRKRASYSEILERCWRHNLQA